MQVLKYTYSLFNVKFSDILLLQELSVLHYVEAVHRLKAARSTPWDRLKQGSAAGSFAFSLNLRYARIHSITILIDFEAVTSLESTTVTVIRCTPTPCLESRN